MQILLYLSTANSLLSDEDILNILRTSRKFNQKHNITGLLLYHQGSFLQVIEGQKDIIHDLFYKKISLDKRHQGVIEVFNHEIKERSFEEWSMGFKQISNYDWTELKGHIDISNNNDISRVIISASDEIITLINSYSDVNQLRL